MDKDKQQIGRVHGGLSSDLLRIWGVRREAALDLSVNINPYGPCPQVMAAIKQASIDYYPDAQGEEFKNALATRLGCPAAEIIVGNGAVDLLWSLARALLRSGETAVALTPCFSEFGAAVQALDASLKTWPSSPATNFEVNLEGLPAFLQKHAVRVVYICNPNSPTGGYLPLPKVRELALKASHVMVILDEAFLSLSEHAADAAIPLPANVVRVRSLTKDFAIPGLRLGYAMAPAALVALMERQRPSWSINNLALAAGLAALDAEAWLEATRARLLADRQALSVALAQLGFTVYPSTTVFVLAAWPDRQFSNGHAMRAGASGKDSRSGGLQDSLRRLGSKAVLLRDCTSYGLTDMVRICARPAADLARLIEILREELKS